MKPKPERQSSIGSFQRFSAGNQVRPSEEEKNQALENFELPVKQSLQTVFCGK